VCYRACFGSLLRRIPNPYPLVLDILICSQCCLTEIEKLVKYDGCIKHAHHYQFSLAHPFHSINHCIKREQVILMIVWELLSQPLLYLSIFIEKNRTEYYDRLLAITQKGDWEGWINAKSQAFRRTPGFNS